MTAALIAIASGKGGVGKTFLSIALAQGFAASSQRVLLIDGDLGLANIDVQLGVSPRGDLLSVIAGGMALAGAVTPFDGGAGSRRGFDLIAGRSGDGALRGLPGHELRLLAESLRLAAAGYDRTILDLGAGIEPAVLELAAASGQVLVVLTDEPTSLTDAYALIKVLSRRSAPPRVAVAVNMAGDEAEGRRSYAALERAALKFLGFAPPLAGIIRRDAAVRAAIRAQVPYLTRDIAGRAAGDIARLTRQIDTAFAPPPVRAASLVR